MPLDIERAGAGHFDHIQAPQAFGAAELDERAASAHPLPRLQRQVLHPADADRADDRDLLLLHELVVGHGDAFEGAKACLLRGRSAHASDPGW